MSDPEATASPPVHTIRFDLSDGLDRGVRIVIDDTVDFIALHGDRWVGYEPDKLFAPDLPLLPTVRPHRTSIAQCSCQTPGCGNISPVVATTGRDESQVVWSDFANLGSAVGSPSDIDLDVATDTDQRQRDDVDDRRAELAGIVFDRLQYERAVRAAAADRSWETPPLATARLLRGLLTSDAAALASFGYRLNWTEPIHRRTGYWAISLTVPRPRRTAAQDRADALLDVEHPLPDSPSITWRDRLRLRPWELRPSQVIVELTTAPGAPLDQAVDLYRQLQRIPITDWPATFPSSDPRGRALG